MLRYARASRSFFAVSAVIVVAQTAVTVGFAWLLARTLVGAIAGEPVASLLPSLAAAFALVVVRAVLIALSEQVSAAGAARASLQLRDRLVAAVQRLGPAWLARRSAPELAVTAGHGLDALDAYFGRYLPQLVATALTTPIVVVAIFAADPVSALTVIVTLPLIPLFMVLIGLATRAVQRRQFDTLARLAARFADTVGGLGTLKVFGRQHRAARRIETVTADYKRETMTVLRVSFLSGFALEFLASISVAIIAVTIGLRLLAGEMDLLVGLFVLLLAPEAYLPLRQVGVHFHAAAEGVAATDRIFAVLDAAATATDAAGPGTGPGPGSRADAAGPDAAETATDAAGPGATETATDAAGPGAGPAPGPTTDAAGPGAGSGPDPASGALSFATVAPLLSATGLRVRRDGMLLPAVDLHVRPGRVLLLEGPSGAGKSSVVAALLGFAVYEGDLRVRGDRVAHARDEIAWAGQRPGLVSGTVAENVALGDDARDDDLVGACLAAAQAHPIAPDRVLGAQGAGLSGGQAQRVALARALYRLRRSPASVLVLDEPTSALDADTEARVWDAVRAEADAGAAVVLVSHRTSAHRIADEIVRLPAPAVAGGDS
nr:ABC transporter transmembrane domain-containing protein [Microbacterium luticocti]